METSNQNKVINQPELLAYIIESINRFTRKYRKEHGSMPSVAEIFFHGVVNFCRKNKMMVCVHPFEKYFLFRITAMDKDGELDMGFKIMSEYSFEIFSALEENVEKVKYYADKIVSDNNISFRKMTDEDLNDHE